MVVLMPLRTSLTNFRYNMRECFNSLKDSKEDFLFVAHFSSKKIEKEGFIVLTISKALEMFDQENSNKILTLMEDTKDQVMKRSQHFKKENNDY